MSFGEWAAHQVKKSKQLSGYDPKDFGNKYYRKEDYDTYRKKTPLEQIIDCRDTLRSPYKSRPSDAQIEKVLTHALAEMTNLQKTNEKLDARVKELLIENDTICDKIYEEYAQEKDKIIIIVGDEEVIIDGDLAAQTIQNSVKDYIEKALSDLVDKA